MLINKKKTVCTHHLFNYFDPKMVLWKQAQTISDVQFSERYPRTLFLSPTWKHTEDDMRTQRSDSIPVRRQNKLWRKITRDSSSRARKFKASIDVYSVKQSAWGGRDGCQSPLCFVELFLLSADKAATDTVRTWRLTPLAVGHEHTHLRDWRQTLFAGLAVRMLWK